MNNPAHAFGEIAAAMRRASRTNLYLGATLIGDHWRAAVTVRNLSSSGALVRAQGLLEHDGQITLVRGSLRATGVLAWRDGRNGGIAFDAPIEVTAWAPGATNRAPTGQLDGQRDVERRIALSRGQVAPLAPRRSMPVDPADARVALDARMAEELAFAARRLEALGTRLADDPGVMIRHAVELQDLDITGQVLGHLARLLAAPDPAIPLATIGMEDLRRRLERSTLG